MVRKERKEIKPRRELSDLIYGNWEALNHAIGSLLPATVYAFGLRVIEVSQPDLSAGEAVAAGLGGSFAIRYAGELVDFLIPQIQRESYIRKNQREIVRTAARAGTALAASVALSYSTDSPFLYTAALTIASFLTGKSATEKIPEMRYSTTIPISTFLLGSCLHLSMSGIETTATIIKENTVVERKTTYTENLAEKVEGEYTAKPPFMTWPALYSKRVNSCFGYRGEHVAGGRGTKHHGGLDIEAPWHTPIMSVGNGTVIEVDAKRWGSVTIDHGNGITTQYLHMDEVFVKKGDKIKAGTEIGLSGGKGPKGRKYYDAHLHFIVDDSGVSPYLQDASGNKAVLESGNVNPLCYVDEDIGFTTSKRSGCNTQGGKNKYCGLYKSPLELVIDIEEKYGEIVRRYVDPKRFDPGLMYALIAQESQGVLDAGSKQGAYGPMQFTPPTAAAYGLCDNSKCKGRDDRTDPEKSISAGVAYYERLQEEFKDYADKDFFAIAAYNAGSELIRRAIEKTEWSDPTWDQVSVMITQDLIADVYGTKHGMANINAREKKALEIKDHVNNVKGYYSFYTVVKNTATDTTSEPQDTDATRIKDQ